ncbi:hypothetical protein XBKQ1_1580003 [Xenorhabdus bovienii str. kraussei Quebec]|uniref:Uncharacterized protein n=1 Tax=Xenorhabdus bovienii str. kraussei Quebec TaxID=1398203 RepID=A0A077PDQ7_XENBV|nr:hypothetical protein XBKQ1_1580003 [Xenorhabdus bovienii str. kraussei Quebec]
MIRFQLIYFVRQFLNFLNEANNECQRLDICHQTDEKQRR